MTSLCLHDGQVSYNRQIPDTWNELTADQLLKVADILYNPSPDVTSIEVALLVALGGINRHTIRRMLPEVMKEQLLPLVSWIRETEEPFTRQLLPIISISRGQYFGPADYLKNIRFAEFDFAERDLHQWHQDPEDELALYRFIACLYRRPRKNYDHQIDPDGDRREKFNYVQAERNAVLLQQGMSRRIAMAILLWYKGCRHFITTRHHRIFDGANQSDDPAAPAYFGLMREIAKTGTYGPFEQVEDMYMYNALHEMECALDEQEEIKRAAAQKTSAHEA